MYVFILDNRLLEIAYQIIKMLRLNIPIHTFSFCIVIVSLHALNNEYYRILQFRLLNDLSRMYAEYTSHRTPTMMMTIMILVLFRFSCLSHTHTLTHKKAAKNLRTFCV